MGNVSQKLMAIQTHIKAPKNLYNSFGKYKYRSAEGICEAVKPFLASENASLLLTDEIVEVGGRIYVKSTAILTDNDTGEHVSTSAFAREPEDKKGMDDSQITGTASSYARKYALNGLFLLDDTKDADAEDCNEPTKEETFEAKRLRPVLEELARIGYTTTSICKTYKLESIEKMSDLQIKDFLNKAKAMPDKEQ